METKLQKVYKLVTRFDGKLWSFNVNPEDPNWNTPLNLLYIPGEWTYPKIHGSLLFALSEECTFGGSRTALWEGQADVLVNPREYVPGVLNTFLTLGYARSFWKNPFGFKHEISAITSIFPATVLCTRIMLTKEIEVPQIQDIHY